jgi:hypothetical protein
MDVEQRSVSTGAALAPCLSADVRCSLPPTVRWRGKLMKFNDDATLQAAATITAARIGQYEGILDDAAVGKLFWSTFAIVQAIESLGDRQLTMHRDKKVLDLKQSIEK